jgi:hypothetical protein
VVRKTSTPVGGLVSLTFKDTMVVPWASCRKEDFPLCPNMLMYWETIAGACAQQLRQFDFGRSTRDSGTYRFKHQWGAVEAPLFWYTIPVHRRDTAHDALPRFGGAGAGLSRVWQRLPPLMTRHLGPHLRKYLIQ